MNPNTIMPQQVMDHPPQQVPQHPFAEKDVQAVASYHLCGKAWYHTRKEFVTISRMEPCLLICDHLKTLLPFFKGLVPEFFRTFFKVAIAFPARLLGSPMGQFQIIAEKLVVTLNCPQHPFPRWCQRLTFFKVERGSLFQGFPFWIMCWMLPFFKGSKAPTNPRHHGAPCLCISARFWEISNEEMVAQRV